jgi:hypothetical protein
MSGMVRKLERHRDLIEARKYREGELWKLLVNFCQLHEKHGEMEYQSDGEADFMACLLCGVSFDCRGELPRLALDALMRRFTFSVWLSI